MKANILISILLLLSVAIRAQTFLVDTLLYNGDPNRYLNMVIVGDGYTASEQDKLRTDADDLSKLVFKKRPFSNYVGYFNVFLIHVVSQESGAIHPNTAADCSSAAPPVPISNPKTYFKTTFDYGNIHRLVVPTNYLAFVEVLSNNIADYDIVFVVVNTPYYGGSGGTYATATAHDDAGEIAAHEIGHSFAFLADEYWAGNPSEKPNMTQQSNPALVKWKNWLNTPGTGISIYPFSEDQAWHRPHQSCLMRQLKNPFCSVCTEAIIERIHTLTKPIVSHSPTTATIASSERYLPFRLTQVMKPLPNTLKTTWQLDGNPVASNTDEYILDQLPLSMGLHTLNLTLLDTTALSKDALHPTTHVSMLKWNIQKSTVGTEVISSTNKISYSIFPNPIGEVLTVEFELENPELVRLELMTTDGRIIQVLNAERRAAGNHAVQHDIGQLPAGTYWLVLQFDATRQVQRVVKL